MMLANKLRYRHLLFTTRPRRYVNLFRTIYQRRCETIVEIGTWTGVHAEQMIRVAAARADVHAVRYVGFDLFEDLTEEQFRQEFSKRPPSYDEVLQRLRATGAKIRLVRGNTRSTLPQSAGLLAEADFVFIDGGHSIDTIASDFNAVIGAVRPGTPVVLDDYYLEPGPELVGLGCQSLIDALDRTQYDVTFLGPVDVIQRESGLLKIRMVLVQRRAGP
jgi:predicted O-methyltransferase YrrM